MTLRMRTGCAAAIVALLCSIGVVTSPARPASAAGVTFVVNSVGDQVDASAADGVCRTAVNTCTLRAAITQANATAVHDTIAFTIPGVGPHRIRPTSALPTITGEGGVTIDGYSQPGSAVNTLSAGSNADIRVELRGQGFSGFAGLVFTSSGNTVRGLAIFDFADHIVLQSNGAAVQGNRIVGNFIGTDATGAFVAAARGVNSNSVVVQKGAFQNFIGAVGAENRNVISGSHGRGIMVTDVGTDGNIVENNVIGLTPDGSAALKNWWHGIDIQYGASDNVVRGNVISGNGRSGVEISHNASSVQLHGGIADTTGNVVEYNLIGTDPTGTSVAAIYGNAEYGVGIEGRGYCQTDCPPDSNRNFVRSNVVIGSEVDVKIWRGSHDNEVTDNWIGVLANGVTGAPGATEWGVLIEVGSFDNLVADNRISMVEKGITVRATSQISSDGVFAAWGNTFRSNSIAGVTSGLGIDLAPEGQPTAAPDPSLVQNGVGIGTVTQATTDRVVVEACSGCVVELFETSERTSDYGQGGNSLGFRTAIDGVATFVFRDEPGDAFVVDPGDGVSALVTDQSGSTSEFSRRATVVEGAVASPPVPTSPAVAPPTTVGGVEPVPAPDPVVTAVRDTGSATRRAVRCSVTGTC